MVALAVSLTASKGAWHNPARMGGGEHAFAAAVRVHEDVLAGIARRLCKNRADADDLLHDTYERALRAWDRYDDRGNLRAWLVSIMNNLFIDRCRKAKRAPASSDVAELELPAPEPVAPPTWASVQTEQVHRALATLSEDFRRVYEMHAIEGKSYDEIAAALGIAKNTVGTRLVRARAKLKAALLAELEGKP